MENEHLLILDMIDNGNLTVVEAVQLIEAMDEYEDETVCCENTVDDPVTIALFLN